MFEKLEKEVKSDLFCKYFVGFSSNFEVSYKFLKIYIQSEKKLSV